jgi:hypothetical protein
MTNMARTSWFDDSRNLPVIDEQVQKLDSFVQAMADGVIEKHELTRQEESLVQAMKAVEGDLTDDQHARITRLLIELSAYNVMRLLHELQTEKLQRALSS